MCEGIRNVGLFAYSNERYDSQDILHYDLDKLNIAKRASLYLTKSDWNFGELKIDRRINSTDHSIYFDLKPRVNFSAISLSFYLKDSAANRCLGWGEMDSYRSWLTYPGNELVPAPSDTTRTFNALVGEFRAGGKQFIGPNGRVVVMKAALTYYRDENYRIPLSWLEPTAKEELLDK
jgi:hypothetical protein